MEKQAKRINNLIRNPANLKPKIAFNSADVIASEQGKTRAVDGKRSPKSRRLDQDFMPRQCC